MMFKYSGGRTPVLNLDWVRVLEETANSTRGLVLLPEPLNQSADLIEHRHTARPGR
jgi:hypothetical protein